MIYSILGISIKKLYDDDSERKNPRNSHRQSWIVEDQKSLNDTKPEIRLEKSILQEGSGSDVDFVTEEKIFLLPGKYIRRHIFRIDIFCRE